MNSISTKLKLISDLKKLKQSVDPEESALIDKIIEIAEVDGNIYDNSFLPGHITGSVWIVSPDYSKVLLIHHKKLDIWIQAGGHSDSNPDTYEVALRELSEETGYTPIKASREIFDVDIHELPFDKKRNVEPHLHLDLRFLVVIDPESQNNIQRDELNDMKWIDLDEVAKYNSESGITRMVGKTKKLRDSYLAA